MHILVVGRGWTGKKMIEELRNRGHTITVCSHENVFETITQDKYDWVVNCAGVTGTPNVDACELDKVNTFYGNAIFPIELAHRCELLGIRMAHFSSGCIYEGTIADVNAKPNFFGSTYSISKGISDMALGDRAQVYRIRMPFSNHDEPKNYLTKVIKYAKTGKLFEGGLNSLTQIDEAVTVACNLIERNEPDGRYNLVNNGAVTLHQIAELIGVQAQWFTPDEFKAATACGRSNCIIPSYHEMSDVIPALQTAITNILHTS